MRRLSLFLLALLLLLAGCHSSGEKPQYSLYFQSASYVAGPALTTQGVTLDENLPVEQALITALLAGPSDAAFLSPIPKGVTLRSWSVTEGLLSVNLSEEYGGLSGMDLTLADYSIALTLCQLPWVEKVSITVESDPMAFRYRQVLTAEDVLLTDALLAPEETP